MHQRILLAVNVDEASFTTNGPIVVHVDVDYVATRDVALGEELIEFFDQSIISSGL